MRFIIGGYAKNAIIFVRCGEGIIFVMLVYSVRSVCFGCFVYFVREIFLYLAAFLTSILLPFFLSIKEYNPITNFDKLQEH